MKKVVMIIQDDPELVKIIVDVESKIKHIAQRSSFIKKSIESLDKDAEKERVYAEEKIINRLLELKRLPPDYSKETHHIDVDIRSGAISLDLLSNQTPTAYTLRDLLEFMEKMK